MATLTEVFQCLFLSCKANARVKSAKDGARPALFLIFVLFYVFFFVVPCIFVLLYVLFVLCRSLYCLCVYVCCTTATGWLPNTTFANNANTTVPVKATATLDPEPTQHNSLDRLQIRK